jgi:hypothetical protein
MLLLELPEVVTIGIVVKAAWVGSFELATVAEVDHYVVLGSH